MEGSRRQACRPAGAHGTLREYFGFLAKKGAIVTAVFIAPVLGLLGAALLAALFGWLASASPF